MAFYESPRFPENIAKGASGGPQFDTEVVATRAAVESRNQRWRYPIHRWEVSQGINGEADHDALRAFFLTMGGRAHGFRFKDWTDYRATHSTGRAVGITSTTFQLVKRYTSGSQTLDRRIRKPIAAGLVVHVSGSPATFTLDATTGIVTIGAAPAASAVTWAGEFDVPVRFDTDQMQAVQVGRNSARGVLQQWAGIPIVELLNP